MEHDPVTQAQEIIQAVAAQAEKLTVHVSGGIIGTTEFVDLQFSTDGCTDPECQQGHSVSLRLTLTTAKATANMLLEAVSTVVNRPK